MNFLTQCSLHIRPLLQKDAPIISGYNISELKDRKTLITDYWDLGIYRRALTKETGCRTPSQFHTVHWYRPKMKISLQQKPTNHQLPPCSAVCTVTGLGTFWPLEIVRAPIEQSVSHFSCLLFGIYLQGTGYPNMCWNFAGIAEIKVQVFIVFIDN